MKRILVSETPSKVGKVVRVAGWVNSRRDHGGLIFIDLRDKAGLIQIVFNKKLPSHKEANELRPEWVIEVEGEITKRPDSMVNKDIITGEVELKAKKLNILAKAKTPPFNVISDGRDIGEETRLKHRYLDLRRQRLQKNLRSRHKVNNYIRSFFTKKGFTEIETPYISKSTPEGARDYVVPSRLNRGEFYALPQSPQQYKQLLMVGGLEKYFQIVRCFRDEDIRGDRQPEFTQLDLEMSFIDEEDILSIAEELVVKIVEELYPEKNISKKPFPRLTYKEVMEKHETDRPDLRKNKKDPNELAFAFITEFPMFEKKEDGSLGATHHPFTKVSAKQKVATTKALDLIAEQYDLVLNGEEIAGGSIREHSSERLQGVFEILGHSKKETEDNFGHILDAFNYGVPPHGGIAFGLDRLIMILQSEPNIREVIAFPKTGDGRDLMMESPAKISERQLEELGIKITKDKK